MSEFHVQIVRIGPVRKHPNADTLSITDVEGGYPCVFRTGEFLEGGVAVYLPVDSMVPNQEEYRFLGGKDLPPGAPIPDRHRRIKAKKIRGTFSMGMLVPLPLGIGCCKIGQDVAKEMEIAKWEPGEVPRSESDLVLERVRTLERSLKGWPWYRKIWMGLFWRRLFWKYVMGRRFKQETLPNPANTQEYTDLEGMRKYGNVLVEGEQVIVTEKIHGTNARFLWDGKKFYAGSHHQWKRPPSWGLPKSWWWRAVELHDLQAKMKKFPGKMFCGEIYGPGIQKGFEYGAKDLEFRCFDILDTITGRYLNYDEFFQTCVQAGVLMVPVFYEGPWNDKLRALSEGTTSLGRNLAIQMEGPHVREGIVVKPMTERWDALVGRVALKLPGQGYLLKRGEQ